MTNPRYTHVAILVDRSGSMASIRGATEAGIDALVAEQFEASATDDGELTVSLSQFDHNYEQVWWFTRYRPARYILEPRGNTALLDAMGHMIRETGRALNGLAEQDRPGQVFFVVATDGYENASRFMTKQAVADLVAEHTDVWKWRFIYLGANQDAFAEAGGIGIGVNSTLNYIATPTDTARAYAATSQALLASRASGGDFTYTDAQRATA